MSELGHYLDVMCPECNARGIFADQLPRDMPENDEPFMFCLECETAFDYDDWCLMDFRPPDRQIEKTCDECLRTFDVRAVNEHHMAYCPFCGEEIS